MNRLSGLVLVVLIFFVITSCSTHRMGAVEARTDSPFYQHPDGVVTYTPFLPATFTPTTISHLVQITPPPPTATIFPTPSPSPTTSPLPVWSLVEWPPPSTPAPVAIPTPMPPIADGKAINLLLLGSDRRPAGTAFRTDTIVIASIRPKDNTVSLISVPRDLYVYIPGWTMNRINTAYFYGERTKYSGGGQALLKDTVLYNLGIPIDHTIMVEFEGFKNIIDTLGGLEVPLVCEFTDWRIIDNQESDEDPDNWELHTVGPGIVGMDGDMALWYVRSRLRSSDYDRGRRQQEILRAAFSKVVDFNIILRIPALYMQLKDTVQTDMGLDGIIELAPLARHLHAPNLRSFYITNKMVSGYRSPEGASVLLPDGEAVQALLELALSSPARDVQERLEEIVEVWNGTSEKNWDVLAAERLHYAGYKTKVSHSDHHNYEKSILYDFTLDQDTDRSRAFLKRLGIPTTSVKAAPGEHSEYSYRLVIGADYNPCFNPTR
jgi:polyisoprenyl-teichoic acid--peptidoglycan teichoic acid transferase